MTDWFWNFILYSFFGYLLERLFAAATRAENQVRRCFWLLPLCPVYGLAVTAVLALPPSMQQFPWLPVAGAIVTTAVEYAVHWVYQTWLGVQFWDYSALRFHIRGRICLPFSIVWGILVSAAVVLVQPVIRDFTAAIPPEATLAAMLLLTADALVTLRYLAQTGDVTFTAPRRRSA